MTGVALCEPGRGAILSRRRVLMSKRAVIILAAWLFSLIAITVIAQSRPVTPDEKRLVISGNDIGFRVDRYEGRRPVGVIVVRVDGQWIEPKSVPQPRPLGSP